MYVEIQPYHKYSSEIDQMHIIFLPPEDKNSQFQELFKNLSTWSNLLL